MKNRIFVFVLSAFFSLWLIGCGQKGAATPQDTLVRFANAFNARDAEAIYNLTSSDVIKEAGRRLAQLKSSEEIYKKTFCEDNQIPIEKLDSLTTKEFFIANMKLRFRNMDKQSEYAGKKIVVNFEIFFASIGTEKAVIKARDYSGAEVILPFTKENGIWKLDFDPTTMR